MNSALLDQLRHVGTLDTNHGDLRILTSSPTKDLRHIERAIHYFGCSVLSTSRMSDGRTLVQTNVPYELYSGHFDDFFRQRLRAEPTGPKYRMHVLRWMRDRFETERSAYDYWQQPT